MIQNTGNSLNCPCGYGNDLPIDTEKCPKCGLNLEPLSRIYQLSWRYNKLGDENKDNNRPGVALSYYNSAQQSAIRDDAYPLLQAIDIFIDEKNCKLAEDLLKYGKEQYPDEKIWNDAGERLSRLKSEIAGKERRQYIIKTSLYIISGLLIIVLSSFGFFLIKSASKEKPLSDYSAYYQKQITNTPGLESLKVYSDSLIRFSGKINQDDYLKLWSLLSTADLPLTKVNLSEVSFNKIPEPTYIIDYKVRAGESLSKIAFSIFSDPDKWNLIFDTNRDVISDRNKLKPGINLKIPIEKASDNE